MMVGKMHSISLPLKVHSIFMVSQQDWLLTEHQTNKYYNWHCHCVEQNLSIVLLVSAMWCRSMILQFVIFFCSIQSKPVARDISLATTCARTNFITSLN